MAGKRPMSDEWKAWMRDLGEKKKREDAIDPITKKKQANLPMASRIKNYSGKYNREDEGRINTKTEADYNRWIGNVETRQMKREAENKAWVKAGKPDYNKIRSANRKKKEVQRHGRKETVF